MSEAVFAYEPEPRTSTVWDAALGLGGRTGLDRLDRIQEGLPVVAFQRFADASGVSRETLAKAIHVSLRTVQRRGESGGRLDPAPSERLVRLAELYERASDLMGGDALARHWMQAPRDVFEDRTPFELGGSELGAREVEDLLLRIEHGVFY